VLVKTCTLCKTEKPIADFFKAAREKDGLQHRCKACDAKTGAAYRAANAEKDRQRHAKYHAANKAKLNKKTSDWQKKNRDKCRARSRKYYHANKEVVAARMKAWEEKNPDWKRTYTKKWRAENTEHRKAYEDKYWRANKALVYAKTARRRAAKAKATVLWADKAKIFLIYAQCVEMSAETGIEHHVDHIVPLQSPIVCGLHWEGNLQIITGSENSKKCNSYWPDMP
jgi:hypothetical protein